MLERYKVIEENLIERLMHENAELKREVATLRNELSFLNSHERLARGIRGETLLANLIGADLTSHTAGHDLVREDGLMIEVKSARLNIPTERSATKRWVWGRLFGAGADERKAYDYVILVGERDDRYAELYAEPNDPFVFFVLPYSEVRQFCTGSTGNAMITLTTRIKEGMKNQRLFTHYMMSMAQIEKKFEFL